MPLSWNEIRQRAITFSRNWTEATRERAEAQTFWNEFFEVFGLRRRTVATFEEPVRNLGGGTDFIDLFWKGRLIAEHKSRGRDLGRAHTQAIDYIQSLHRDGREEEVPRYIVVSDFARIALHDLEAADPSEATLEFSLDQLSQHIRRFTFITGHETRQVDAEDPANLQATELLANVHDRLHEGGYTGHDLQRFMVRVLFCLFAEDTGIFEPQAFTNFILQRTRPDGSDLGPQLARLFEILNTPDDRRQNNLDEDLAQLPYVNGDLFSERLSFADFNSAMREALLTAARFRWEKISPAVFGSLFQSIMEDRARRQIGAHYTSERDILKLIRSLFLDDLRAEFESIRHNKAALARFGRKLGQLTFLDPACGCGNFLVIAYRELRALEMDVIAARFSGKPDEADIRAAAHLNVSQFYGIEIEEWPARIAEVAMWLMDHQMNSALFQRFGQPKATVPLSRSPHIVHGNALRIDWNDVLPADQCSYILGNPPFVGKHLMDEGQRSDMDSVAGDVSGSGVLDYVTGWYFKASRYVTDTSVRVAFVSTNSITQGEQVGVLWQELFRRGVRVLFGHRTFAWMSEARGRAHVHVVIIGWSLIDTPKKYIFDYETDPAHPTVTEAQNISPYLTEGPDIVVTSRSKPLCDVPPCQYGSKPADGGHLIIEDSDRHAFLTEYPEAAQYIRPLLCAGDYLNNLRRWCLWLVNASPADIRTITGIRERVEAVRRFRASSRKAPTRELAEVPYLFAEIRQPSSRFIVIPQHTSETRNYIPFGYFAPDHILHNSCSAIPDATLFHVGVLSSEMHMAWVRQVCGRLKSDYRYSSSLVYNNFPWPQDVGVRQRERVEAGAQAVLDARAMFPESTLADLYDPLTMPAPLRKAHAELDRAVDACYRPRTFQSERERVEYLFVLYQRLVHPLVPAQRTRRRAPTTG